MPACAACHAAKVKCDHDLPDKPCSRCVRIGRECVLHESRQGQRNSGASPSKRQRTLSCHEDGLPSSEDACLSIDMKPEALKNDHYGLHYLIRSWFSFAFRRRSMPLLSRAASMAARCGLSMDQILCETKTQRGCDFLFPILLLPTNQQQVVGARLSYSELPRTLLTAVDCPIRSPEDLNDRWIWIRDMNRGVSRYFCSPGFEEHVATFETIIETYQTNEQAVVDLFLSPTERQKHTRCLASQISIHSSPGVALRPSRLSKVSLKTRQGEDVPVDEVCCIEIMDLDQAFLYIEFIRREKSAEPPEPMVASMQPLVAAAVAPDLGGDLPFLDLDNLEDDKELEHVLDLLLR